MPVANQDVVYVDDDIVVYNKPTGMPAHPLADADEVTALKIVSALYPEIASASEDPREGGLCHRLDNDTSGLLVFARNPTTYLAMREAFTANKVHRIYIGLATGVIRRKMVLNAPIAHHAKNKSKMVVTGDEGAHFFRGSPQPATTQVWPIAKSASATLFLAKLEGGRRHQIRVHLSNAGHPLVGDVLYGAKKSEYLSGQALHALCLRLPNRPVILVSPPHNFLLTCQENLIGPDNIDKAVKRAIALIT